MCFVSVVTGSTKYSETGALSIGVNWSCAVIKQCTNNIENGRVLGCRGTVKHATQSTPDF